jgi:hypothetical protein
MIGPLARATPPTTSCALFCIQRRWPGARLDVDDLELLLLTASRTDIA